MFSSIIKNLWHRRLHNGWLLAELILVTIVAWVILDPVVVDTYDMNRPLGYDADRMFIVSISELEEGARGYDPSREWGNSDDLHTLLTRIRQHPQVENATLLMGEVYPSASSSLNRCFTTPDSIDLQIAQAWFEPSCDYFKTFGIKSATDCGSPSIDELDNMSLGESDVILTRTAASALLPDGGAIGREISTKDYGNGSSSYRIVGIVEDVRNNAENRNPFTMFTRAARNAHIGSPKLFVRIRPDVNPEQFLANFRPYMAKELKVGNMSCRKVIHYTTHNANVEYSAGGNAITLKKLLALFFLINLALGVVGTFWLQTRTRRRDVGIMRSFGATTGRIRAMLIGEGLILTVIAWVVGCVIYLQWALVEGLSNGRIWQDSSPLDTGWVCSFWPHFIGVSLIVLVLMLAVVLLGIWLPARKLSRTDPVTALHEE